MNTVRPPPSPSARLQILAGQGNFEAQIQVNQVLAEKLLFETSPRRLRPKSTFLNALSSTRQLHGTTLLSLAKKATNDYHNQTLISLESTLIQCRNNAQLKAFDISTAQDVFVLLSQFLGLETTPMRQDKGQPAPSLTSAMKGALAMKMMGDAINHINSSSKGSAHAAEKKAHVFTPAPPASHQPTSHQAPAGYQPSILTEPLPADFQQPIHTAEYNVIPRNPQQTDQGYSHGSASTANALGPDSNPPQSLTMERNQDVVQGPPTFVQPWNDPPVPLQQTDSHLANEIVTKPLQQGAMSGVVGITPSVDINGKASNEASELQGGTAENVDSTFLQGIPLVPVQNDPRYLALLNTQAQSVGNGNVAARGDVGSGGGGGGRFGMFGKVASLTARRRSGSYSRVDEPKGGQGQGVRKMFGKSASMKGGFERQEAVVPGSHVMQGGLQGEAIEGTFARTSSLQNVSGSTPYAMHGQGPGQGQGQGTGSVVYDMVQGQWVDQSQSPRVTQPVFQPVQSQAVVSEGMYIATPTSQKGFDTGVAQPVAGSTEYTLSAQSQSQGVGSMPLQTSVPVADQVGYQPVPVQPSFQPSSNVPQHSPTGSPIFQSEQSDPKPPQQSPMQSLPNPQQQPSPNPSPYQLEQPQPGAQQYQMQQPLPDAATHQTRQQQPEAQQYETPQPPPNTSTYTTSQAQPGAQQYQMPPPSPNTSTYSTGQMQPVAQQYQMLPPSPNTSTYSTGQMQPGAQQYQMPPPSPNTWTYPTGQAQPGAQQYQMPPPPSNTSTYPTSQAQSGVQQYQMPQPPPNSSPYSTGQTQPGAQQFQYQPHQALPNPQLYQQEKPQKGTAKTRSLPNAGARMKQALGNPFSGFRKKSKAPEDSQAQPSPPQQVPFQHSHPPEQPPGMEYQHAPVPTQARTGNAGTNTPFTSTGQRPVLQIVKSTGRIPSSLSQQEMATSNNFVESSKMQSAVPVLEIVNAPKPMPSTLPQQGMATSNNFNESSKMHSAGPVLEIVKAPKPMPLTPPQQGMDVSNNVIGSPNMQSAGPVLEIVNTPKPMPSTPPQQGMAISNNVIGSPNMQSAVPVLEIVNARQPIPSTLPQQGMATSNNVNGNPNM